MHGTSCLPAPPTSFSWHPSESWTNENVIPRNERRRFNAKPSRRQPRTMGVNSASITGACLADFQGGASNDGLYLACCSTRSRIGPPQGFTQGAVLAERVTERGRKACQVLPREVTITHPGSSAPSMINYPRGPRSSASSSPYEPRGGTQHNVPYSAKSWSPNGYNKLYNIKLSDCNSKKRL